MATGLGARAKAKTLVYYSEIRFIHLVYLARIFHEYATIRLVANIISGIVSFMRKDSLYQTRRLPNANLF